MTLTNPQSCRPCRHRPAYNSLDPKSLRGNTFIGPKSDLRCGALTQQPRVSRPPRGTSRRVEEAEDQMVAIVIVIVHRHPTFRPAPSPGPN
ncbi:hypothetical protein GQ602_004054 [Ophiocordyceps camponoti-floridani]|uniref:Uncharacterized protein n=1 Tax=Ophiocordyceps camponoti-floridani TaxID=2030778 RepID=A0A8H4VD75_9HYPO|nr:hypothetical protein GQ602_004054 [Ophiocordyceps camponoti-floridani]